MAAGVLPALLLTVAGKHMVMFVPAVHIIVVGTAGLVAAVAATAMSVIGARRNDGHAVWTGMAFSVIATMLLIHALATPGALLGANGVVQIAGALNLPISCTILAASALPALRRPFNVHVLLRIQAVVVVVLASAGAAALVFARLIPVVPTPSTAAANLIFAAGAIPLVLLAWRAARTYLLTRRHADLIVCVGVVWLIGAQYGLLDFAMMDAAWWAAHAVGSRPLVGNLRAGDLVEHEEAFLGGRVRALLVRLGEKDPSTEGHTRRVATLAVALGERLGLPESRLRQLALGGLLHDIGKLSVANEILNKPAQLSDEEFAEIRRHPGAGRELLTELGGFSALVLDLVESHHERLDGGGYPNQIAANELDLGVRILTVADVYDALTANRVYRKAWSVDRALALLEHDTGQAFDPDCVSALRSLVTAQQRLSAGAIAASAPGQHPSAAAQPA